MTRSGFFLLAVLVAHDAFACFLSPTVGDWMEHGLYVTRWLWAATLVVGLLIAFLAWQRRAWFAIGIAGLAVAFHPSWTIAQSWAADCTNPSIQASLALFAFLVPVLLYQSIRFLRQRRHPLQSAA
jgi:hypothetical protein